MLIPKIKMQRKKARLTQEQLGDLAGINAAHISKYENGKIYPSLETLWRIANVLNCLVDDLYETAE